MPAATARKMPLVPQPHLPDATRSLERGEEPCQAFACVPEKHHAVLVVVEVVVHPAKPGRMLRLSTMTDLARSTSRMGIP